MPNVRAKLPAEAGFVSPVRASRTIVAHRAYKACLRGQLSSNVRRRKPGPLDIGALCSYTKV